MNNNTVKAKIEHEDTGQIVCPYCGYKVSDSWEMDDAGDWICSSCEKTFEYQRNVFVSYTSRKKKCKDKIRKKMEANHE